MVNILISNKKMQRGGSRRDRKSLTSQRRLKNLKIRFLDVSPQTDYDFSEFFYHVREGILSCHSGVGDVIHGVVMKNNGIADILTFDEKDDFKKIPDLTVLHPRDVTLSNK
jgi:predicted nucleic acid-binding protein